MGLSSKKVSSDGHGTLELPTSPSMKRKSSQQQSEPLKCPRCDSSNTKFCYYNNYNKSQPRHFCKACKRHWTKGGTLRNVPVGGGRKNKRFKTSNSGGKTASRTDPTTKPTTKTTDYSGISNNNHPLGGVSERNLSEAFYQTLVRQPPLSIPESSITLSNKSLNDGNSEIFLGSTLSVVQNEEELQFPYSNLGSFESNPCSMSSTIQSSNLYNFTMEADNLEETVMNSLNTTMNSSSKCDLHQPWMMPTTTNSVMDMSINWGWDDFDNFVSVETDLTIPWEDTIKP